MSQPPTKKLVVIDGKSVFYRGFYAMPNLSTKDGTPTGGVYGFAMMALEVIKRLKPDYVAVAWDKPKTNIRKRLAIYPAYKAGRKPAPPDFYAQIPVLQELLATFGWPLYELDDYEADDIMGTLAVQASARGIETLLITSDLDMLQLINDQVHVYALKTGLSNIELYSPETFSAKYGISVDQFLDLKALKGDSSDNIPGVPGIGEKGGVSLLQEYKTLDGVYDNLALLKDSLRKKLEAGKESAYMSKELAQIWVDAPLTLDLDAVDGTKADPVKIMELLKKLEFKSLVRQLPEIMQVDLQSLPTSINLRVGTNTHIANKKQLAELDLSTAKQLYIHSRSAGKHGQNPELLMLSIDGHNCYTLDLKRLPKAALLDQLSGIRELIGYDVKYSLKLLIACGLTVTDVKHDVLIGAYIINSLRREQSLTDLARTDLGYEGSAFEDLDMEELSTRAAEVLAVIKGLYDSQSSELKALPKLLKLAKSVEWPVIPVLADMEYVGIQLDTAYLSRFSVEIDDSISDLEQQIYGHSETEFNIASPAQLADILFQTLKLPTTNIKKGKTSYSTAASELDKLRGSHPIIDLITSYREVAKLKNTYVDALPKLVDSQSRVHTTFNLTIAQTGRLSSTDPNLQNIPTRTDLGRRIRTAFIAGKGNLLVSADYSQFELRLAAVLAEDSELIELFNQGADIHTATAAQVYSRELEDVTKQMRQAAKVINFGILYGMSPHGLSAATGMTYEQAGSFITRYKDLRRPLFDYMDRVREQARKDGYVETLFGRRRPMPDIHSPNFLLRQAAERAAINMPIQGTEADLMKLAMIQAHAALLKQFPKAKMLLQIHDSILVECPQDQAEAVAALLKVTMETIYKLPVRLDVDVTIADNWGGL